MVERLGDVKAFAVPYSAKNIIYPLISQYADKSATVGTDESHV
jgi:hypothetical protein